MMMKIADVKELYNVLKSCKSMNELKLEDDEKEIMILSRRRTKINKSN